MSSDFYGQGQGGRDQHVRQWILTRLDESDDQFQPPQSGTSGSPSWQEQGYLSQDSPLSYQDMSQHHDVQQHLQAKSNQTIEEEDKVALAYSHQAAFSIPQGHRSGSSSTGLDGQALYCTEVQSVSPPSQPVTVEGGGTSRRSLVAVNGGARSHPVQYTIIITDPQLQQNSAGNNSSTSAATSILLNTLVQQQQHQHLQLQQQQQQQVQLATISDSNSSLLTGATNANLLVNNNNTNGSSKFGSLLICNNNNSNLSSDGGIVTRTSTFPSNLITSHQNNSFSDGKGIHFTKLTLSANANLSPTLIDRGSIEGGIVILNYSEPQQRTGSATIHNINQLVSVQSKVANGSDLVTQGNTHHLIKPVSEANGAVSGYSNRGVTSNSKVNVCGHSDLHQVDFRARVSAAGSVPYNVQGFVDKEDSGDRQNSQNSISHISQALPFSGELESTSSSNRVSEGMHSGRTGSGSGKAHSSHQQQQHNPVSSSSSFTITASTSGQSDMLSAGQPAVPSGIFRTGTDNTTSSQRLSASASSSYVSPQYPPIYGIHSQATGHLTTLQPYSTFFPGYGASGTSGHTFPHAAVMAGTSQNHYPHIESYSAMLASMGSHAQHRGAQGTDRTLRGQAPVVSVTQHTDPFLSSSVQMAAPGVQQYPSITASSHRRPSGSGSPSPGPATPIHTPPSTSTHLDPHHLEKMAGIKGSSGLQGREAEVSRELRLYGDSFNLLEDKPRLSPSSTYSSSSHIPKVSFDTVVKEYGGGRDSPTGRGDLYFRASLSGKEGSLKHRILTRPSDSEALDDLSRVSGVHGLKDEPLAKRQKITTVVSAAVAYGTQVSHGHHGDSQISSSRYHAVPHTTSQHSQPTNSNTMDSRGAGIRHHPDNSLPGHDSQQPSPYHHHTDDSNSDIRYQPPHYQSSPASSSPSLSPTPECPPSHLQYPSHFMKGSIIQLANGTLKRVEDLQTEDFVNSAEISSDLKVDSSTVIGIEEQPDRGTAMLSFSVGEHQVQVTVEATLEHPFFVFGQGWSSCSVSRTLARYGLDCLKLNVGDVCISLTHKDVHLKAAEIGQLQQDPRYLAEPQNKLTTSMTTGLVSVEHQIPSPQFTSSSTMPFSTAISSSSSASSKAFLSPLKSENTDISFLPPLPSASPSIGKRRLSQTELPPPLSNIVLVKKENNGHNSRRRSLQRVEDELHEEKVFEEEDESDSTLSLRKRRWSAPDPGSVKAEQEREKDRQISGGQNTEETQQTSSADNVRQ